MAVDFWPKRLVCNCGHNGFFVVGRPGISERGVDRRVTIESIRCASCETDVPLTLPEDSCPPVRGNERLCDVFTEARVRELEEALRSCRNLTHRQHVTPQDVRQIGLMVAATVDKALAATGKADSQNG